MSYVSNMPGQRVSRRGALRGTAVTISGLAGAALLGCSSGPARTTAKPGAAIATSAAAAAGTPKRGGILRYSTADNADSLDSNTSASFKSNQPNGFGLSRLFKYKPGNNQPASGEVEGDAVESWEQPDPLSLVLRLRKNMKFDLRPPTSGHLLTSQDVVESFDVFAAKSAYRGDLVNKVNPAASITKWEAVDTNTVKFTLAFPDAALLPTLAWPQDFWVQPVEAYRGGFDPKTEMRGTGPFILEEFKANVSYKYKRNPDWYGGPERPYVDNVHVAIVEDPAQVAAQFKAGNFIFGAGQLASSDVPSLAKSTPNTHVVTGVPSATGVWSFNYGTTSMWKDERVRRALSMSFNRDTFAEVIYSPKEVQALGVKTRNWWMSPLGPSLGAEWLDPQGKDFGPSGQYLKHNPAETKKMLAAAGFDDKKPLTFELCITPQYWTEDWESRAQTLQSMAAEAGIKIQIFNTPYTADWVPNYLRSKTNFKGHKVDAAVAQFTGSNKSSASQTFNVYYSSTGGNTMVGTHFPEIDKMIADHRKILSTQERNAKGYDIQRYIIDKMAVMPVTAVIDLVDVASKKLHGPEQWKSFPGGHIGSGSPSELLHNYWIEA